MVLVTLPGVGSAVPPPAGWALEAIELAPSSFGLDPLDLGLWGGDRWKLPLFDSWAQQPLRIPEDGATIARGLLSAAPSLPNLYMALTGRTGTGVRRGLIGDPVAEVQAALEPQDSLFTGVTLPDSIRYALTLLVGASRLCAQAGDDAMEGIDAPGALGEDAWRLLRDAETDTLSPSFVRGVEEQAGAIDERLWNAGAGDLLLVLDRILPIVRRHASGVRADLPWRAETPMGSVVIAGRGTDHHLRPAPFLLLDLGGDDRYEAAAAGTFDRPVSIAIDLDGDDVYETADTASPAFGAGLLGVGILIDEAGDDRYHGAHLALGAGFCGIGLLVDRAGNDRYDALTHAQGAGQFGAGMLVDLRGTDTYHAFQKIQGFGGVRGAGLLLDREGDDRYVADDTIHRYPSAQSSEHNANLAQGFGFGKRADFVDGHSLAGGLGILLDGGGNDAYSCGIFGQGCAYWYGIGLLLDAGGDDAYDGVWYVQGSAAHFAIGALLDDRGDDRYHATMNMAIGAGHDFSVGVLHDRAGDDLYQAPNLSLGGGNANGIGLFWDQAGDDAYEVEAATTLGRANVASQGSIRDLRETIGLFLDTGGLDRYPAGKGFAGNGRLWTQTGTDTTRILETERGAGIDTTWSPAGGAEGTKRR
jgi:hypothetical protein